MRVFVTGGTGFIGSHLVDRLAAEGYSITCLVRRQSDLRHLFGVGGISVLYSLEQARNCIDGCDVVCHIAGVLGSRKARREDYLGAHVELPRAIINGMNSHQRFVYMSSAWVNYPEKYYELTKLEGEKMVVKSGMDYAIVRPGLVYGPRDYHLLPLFQWMMRLGRLFPIMGGGGNLVCPTYVGDVVEVLVEAVNGGNRILPVAGSPIAMREFIFAIARAMGSPRPFLHIPRVLKSDFFGNERIFDTVREGMALEEGLERTVKWYREEGLL